jgi:hypothetical protein
VTLFEFNGRYPTIQDLLPSTVTSMLHDNHSLPARFCMVPVANPEISATL